MKCQRVLSLLLLVMIIGVTCAEASEFLYETESDRLQEDIVLNDFVIAIDNSWVIEDTDPGDETILVSAITIDNELSLMVFLAGEGNDESVAQTAAINEYSSGIKRAGSEIVNGISAIYAENQATGTVCAYFSVNGHVYTISITSRTGNTQTDEMMKNLKDLMNTVTQRVEQ